MAGAKITFRCYQCNKLLGASRSKVGTVVSCPKCGAELIVPDPAEAEPAQEEAERSPETRAPSAPSPEAASLVGPGSEVDFPNFGPEDIRAVSQADAPPEPAAPQGRAGIRFPGHQYRTAVAPSRAGVVPDSRPGRVPPPPPRTPTPPPSTPTATPRATAPHPVASPPPEEEEEPVFPAVLAPAASISTEAPSLTSSRTPPARRNDVVLPRTAVVLWTFYVLIGSAAAFVSGLLIGHYLWKTP